MIYGLPDSGLAASWFGRTIVQEDYFACIKDEAKPYGVLMITQRDPDSKGKGLPIHEEFSTSEMYIFCSTILDICGLSTAYMSDGDQDCGVKLLGTAPEAILLLLEPATFQAIYLPPEKQL